MNDCEQVNVDYPSQWFIGLFRTSNQCIKLIRWSRSAMDLMWFWIHRTGFDNEYLR